MTSKNRLTEAAYQCLPGGPLDVDKAFYDEVAATAFTEPPLRTLVETFILPIRSGKAWPVRKGDICRIVAVEGAQVCAEHLMIDVLINMLFSSYY